LKEWTTPDFRNTPSTTNLEEEEIVDALGNDDNASMPEEIKLPNPCRKMIYEDGVVLLLVWVVYWTMFGPKLTGPSGDLYYRQTTRQ